MTLNAWISSIYDIYIDLKQDADYLIVTIKGSNWLERESTCNGGIVQRRQTILGFVSRVTAKDRSHRRGA